MRSVVVALVILCTCIILVFGSGEASMEEEERKDKLLIYWAGDATARLVQA